MRRFFLHRDMDESGVSGVGTVAEGVMFSNGKCVINWLTKYTSTGQYDSMEDLLNIHGHNGKTRLVWKDSQESVVDTGDRASVPPDDSARMAEIHNEEPK